MNQGIPTEIVLTLLAMCATGIVFLYGVAQSIRSWVEKKFRERDEDWKVEKSNMATTFANQIERVSQGMREDRDIFAAAIDKVHTRISERVDTEDYYREQRRIDERLATMTQSIETLASSIRHRIDTQQQAIHTQLGIAEGQRRMGD